MIICGRCVNMVYNLADNVVSRSFSLQLRSYYLCLKLITDWFCKGVECRFLLLPYARWHLN